MEAISRFSDAWLPVFTVHMLEMSLFIFLVWGVDRVLRLNTRLRYTLWLLALVKVFVPPIFPLPLPASVVETIPMDFIQGTAASVSSPQGVEATARFTPALLLLGLWTASALFLIGIVVWKNVVLRRRLHGAVPVPIPEAFLKGHSGLFHLRIFSVDTVQSPLLLGFRRPRLYLPEDWTSWPQAQLRGILAHEMAHLQARDLWVLALQTLAVIFFGLNPLVWVLNVRLTHLRELRCDEAAIGETGIQPVDYSKLLYLFLQRQARPSLVAVTGTYFSENHRSIRERFQHLLDLKAVDMKVKRRWYYAVPVLVGIAILPFSAQEGRSRTISEEPLEFWRAENKPELIRTVRPEYPEVARQAGVEGNVFVKFLVGKDGRVGEVQVLKGQDVFRQAAIDAVSQFAFKPAMHNGQPVAVWMTQRMKFNLDRKGEDLTSQTGRSKEFALHPNLPNPFNPETVIRYNLAESASVELQIYNVNGQVVRTLVSEHQAAGRHQVAWDGKDERGASVASGTYLYRIKAGKFQDVKQMMLLK